MLPQDMHNQYNAMKSVKSEYSSLFPKDMYTK